MNIILDEIAQELNLSGVKEVIGVEGSTSGTHEGRVVGGQEQRHLLPHPLKIVHVPVSVCV